MKTTNNKLLDNTGNPVSHNRPMVKETQYRYAAGGKDYKKQLKTGNWKNAKYVNFLEERTVERPMTDTEYIEYLEKEKQELKEMESRALKHNSVLVGRLREQQDQFIKVVESVLGIHIHMNYKCSCGWESETDTFGEHQLQEIKSAIEKGK